MFLLKLWKITKLFLKENRIGYLLETNQGKLVGAKWEVRLQVPKYSWIGRISSIVLKHNRVNI
jgi:hypothetical protein